MTIDVRASKKNLGVNLFLRKEEAQKGGNAGERGTGRIYKMEG